VNDRFYRSFEERYYAPRDVIKSLRRQYFPFVQPIATLYKGASTFDVGCGRGEWLELMSELQLTPFGVDLDEGMLSACAELGLAAEKGDAVERLATFPANSQAIVTAFHVVEHITFDQLRTLVSEALRVLKPGGLLIMETPNPENIVVATHNFYLDPTHQRPIPRQLLSFVAEHAGFERIRTVRLQEQESLRNHDAVTLSDVFKGVSPDYAVIAQKKAPSEVLALFDEPFSVEFGLSQDELLSRFDRHIAGRIERVETRSEQAEEKAQQAEVRAQEAEEKAQQAEAKAQEAEAQAQVAAAKAQEAEEKAQQSEAASNQAMVELHAVYASKSWRITSPLRWTNHQLRLLCQEGLNKRIKAAAKKVLLRMMVFISVRPRLKRFTIACVQRLGVADRLRQVYRGPCEGIGGRGRAQEPIPQELSDLTPRAREIYYQFKEAIKKKSEGD